MATALDRDLLGGAIAVGAAVRRATGCAACQGLGFLGRTGIYEVVTIDRELQAMIHDGAAEAQLLAHARALGPSLVEDGVRKIAQGVTTVEEVARVAQEK